MTKQHFEAAARQVQNVRTDDFVGQVEIEVKGQGNVAVGEFLAYRLADNYIRLFRQFNPRFDSTRFLKACGLEG